MRVNAADAAVTEFFSGWSTYRAVIESDSMEHTVVYGAVHDVLAEWDSPFSILDLGCGDAAGTGPALEGTQVARYVGVDSAAPALEFAHEQLAAASFEVELVVADARQALQDLTEQFDVILASFVLHHFDSDDKRQALKRMRQLLKPGGQVILIDVVRLDGETRPAYLDRYESLVRNWSVTPSQADGIMAHVRGHDFPEERSVEESWFADLGFSRSDLFYFGGTETQAGWVLRA